jgi:hypothetical protein
MEHGEGDGNRPGARARWQAGRTGTPERELLGLSFETTMGNVLTPSPPLVIGRAGLDRALGVLAGALPESLDRPA